ncbi:phosphoglucomutase (alpha-D-glucose-1,6-bisphosphate-dependent) [Shewanella sp. 1_MG-2023]|uniref:phosphoglucomutase (alpha-D-glucose-1,6-bisphosphate-dependent) n=1 Tax=unclassified Shewanella TaxID=196818 RepID=UPI0026E1B3BB|nr:MULTISPECIES: phosphoglucomutase (alpha-D-glucose-1,6-bisphosphate-dependent) [unclassified Shewanella]MDO6612891.1 phosphoglucomutase (alpha-D-glucose-1,6-bisphosphate-dependent) [Shewanella sp. 7_MG-2023]MDO6772579.1 phosphoglucomutase (alpha-D-glucose-1,6-bisphosphate-dependent) [Shewanella sp. 2_MG-2023]MDO6795217.1 phosphoglucomutase (alpha-D-glucose-1,6-bisphosphate-dependent) [Shewanella sp. 1_MG-2023]
MAIHNRAGKVALQTDLINLPKLMSYYYRITPNVEDVQQKVTFGTSGHRGSALKSSFNQNHIWAITQAVVDYRQQAGIKGPMVVGFDTHALSYAAYLSVLEVLTANQVAVKVQKDDGFTPTPVVSQAIIAANANGGELTDGLIITPSHNPPQDGGIKYNPPHGGPAEADITKQIEAKANQYLAKQLSGVQKVNYGVALDSGWIDEVDFIAPYVNALSSVIDLEAIAKAKIRIGVDPLGGSGIYYWEHIAKQHGLNITLVNEKVDPSFGFMTLDKDGKIRMDCSSPYAMAGLLAHSESYDVCVGNDPDYDRHGIVCPGFGLMNPNHYLAVAIDYLLTYRQGWSADLAIGKTLVSSAIIDRICQSHNRQCLEVPVGFKWFVDGLANSTIAFGGEESAGAAFLNKDGSTWCTDKDGFILALLAAEILAVTGKTPAQRYVELTEQFGESFYTRIDSPISLKKKAKFEKLSSDSFTDKELAGETITAILSHAPGNNAAIGGIKVTTENGWFAARPSGTEALFKIYAESFISEDHLAEIISQAQVMIDAALKA